MDDMRPPSRDLDFDVLTAWGADVPATDQVDATGPLGDLADRASAGLHLDPAVGLSVLHVVIMARLSHRHGHGRSLPLMRDHRVRAVPVARLWLLPRRDWGGESSRG
jgi:hypothetical protein